jgi:hypothetical protein
MKSVSWDVAFRKLNEWRERESFITVGPVYEMEDEHGETIEMHWGSSGDVVLSADPTTGVLSMRWEGEINLVGASFRAGDWDDLPFDERGLGPEQYESALEVTFPDGRMLILAQDWPLG